MTFSLNNDSIGCGYTFQNSIKKGKEVKKNKSDKDFKKKEIMYKKK